jgi:hypothetical protein
MDKMSKPGRKVVPTTDKTEKALLEAKYKVFLEQCFKQKEYRNLVDEAIGAWNKKN